MADFYGANATILNTVPLVALEGGDHNSKIHRSYDSITFAAELTTSDALYMQKIPAGAKLVGAKVWSDDLGTTGLLNVGWTASDDAGEAADADGIFAALNVKAAANVAVEMPHGSAGFNKDFAEEVQVVIVPTENTDAATGLQLHLEILYTFG